MPSAEPIEPAPAPLRVKQKQKEKEKEKEKERERERDKERESKDKDKSRDNRDLVKSHPHAVGEPRGSSSRSKGHRRPARVLGATLPGLQLPIPAWVRKELASGWNDHIPLTYLTDEHCQLASLDDILSPPTPACKRETELDFTEWHQAWLRLLCLIADYLPEEHTPWTIHFTRIRDMDNVVSEWDHWLSYDIEVRRCACFNPLDPAIFHSSIWNDLRLKILSNRVKDVALETFRVIQKSTSASNFHEASSRVKRRLEEVVQGTKRLRQHSSRNLKAEREKEREREREGT